MGGGGSKSVADVQAIANTPVEGFMPALGPVNPVRPSTWLVPDRSTGQANPKVFFDISLGRYGDGDKLGRIVME
eukprot:5643505-Pyramimonas_sp.AAC.1